MKPLAPEVVGPISICSASVEVRGNIAGATIEILVDGAVTASHVSTAGDSYYTTGVALQADHKITARQTISGATSPESLVVVVGGVPAQLSPLTVLTHPHTCGRGLAAGGAVPGAIVAASIGTNAVGSTHAVGGDVGITYDPTLANGQTMTLQQTACNNATATQSTAAATPPPAKLLAPQMQLPLIECQNSIVIGGVVDGADVEMYRNDVLEQTFTFGVSQEWFWIKPLVKNDVIKVRQGFKCKSPSSPLESPSPYASATVQPFTALKAPAFVGFPCPGTTWITLGSLTIGARVVLSLNGQELGQTDAPAITYTFTIPPLHADDTLEAHMEMCNQKGPSATMQVKSLAHSPKGLKISDPYACAAYVYLAVDDYLGNYLVFITNQSGQHISGYHNVIGFNALIAVSPGLMAGDKITVNLQACSGVFTAYGPFTVLPGPPPQPSVAQPVQAPNNYCVVHSPAAGSILDVYVNNQWAGSSISDGNLAGTPVLLSNPLIAGQQIYCTQTLCAQTSKPSPPATVVKQPPKAPLLLQPPNGATSVNVQPVFKWQDPGAGSPASADKFFLQITNGNSPVFMTQTTATTFPYPGALAEGTSYQWTVTAANSGGQATANPPFTFHTQAPTPPPQSSLHFVPPILSSVGDFPRNQEFVISIEVKNGGNAPSQAFSVVFLVKDSTDTVVIIQPVTNTQPALAAGASVLVSEPIALFDTNTVFIHVYLMVNNQQVDTAFHFA